MRLTRGRLLALGAALVALAARSAAAQPALTGRWAGRMTIPGGVRLPAVLEIQERGAAVTGTLSAAGNDPEPITTGRRQGDSVFFAIAGTYPTSFRGALAGDSLRFVAGSGPTAIGMVVGRAPLSAAEAVAQRPPEPQPLWPGRAPYAQGDSAADRPTIAAYPAPSPTRNGTAVVVFPGGGYVGLAMGHEGHDVARWLNTLGVSAFVVRYRLGPKYHHPAMLADAQRAIRTVRARAKEWGVDPARVGVIGFSAGGHLASTAGTHFGLRLEGASDAIDSVSARPDFMLLLYPVITMDSTLTHPGSRAALLGSHPDPALVRLLSNETQVTRETPPTFLVHSEDDNVVPVENSLRFYDALRRAGVPGELHVFEHGPHGVGLARDEPLMSAWPRLAEAWMRSHGWLGGTAPGAPAARTPR